MCVTDSNSDECALQFSGRILDNVHGFIYYTKTEEKIINTLLFKRLQGIKQLSIANWVFPGSEHTRFIHSLGVMYIADKIACKLGLTLEERKIVRLAGLLHDIGHYPLSHVCEFPYKKSPASFPNTGYCKAVNSVVKKKIDQFTISPTWDFMKRSTGCHHEKIGADIILNNTELKQIIVDECGNDAISIISDMIIGNVERPSTDPLLVQILHSEIDADGIDYLMRDATFSGTSFGNFELDQLINCMAIGEQHGKRILCITPKGIAAADQYLINKFFSYSQVVFNKHISVTEWMAEQVVDWMQKNSAYFPSISELQRWVVQSQTPDSFIDFTDNFFWSSLQNIRSNPISKIEPTFIQHFSDLLLRHNELEFVENTEIRIVSSDEDNIKHQLQDSAIYANLDQWDNTIAIYSERPMTKQAPKREFMQAIYKKIDDPNQGLFDDDIRLLELHRLMEGICIKDENDLHLLCDDSRSLMQMLYKTHLVILRAFSCPC